MSKGLKIASWISSMAVVVLCYGIFIFPTIMSSILGEAEVDSSISSGDGFVSSVLMILLIAIPIVQIINMVIGIIVAASKKPGTIKTTRMIMFVMKISLIPFFILGGAMVAMFFLMGIHPVLIAFGWGGALAMTICGWFTMISGSIWAIATATHLCRARLISGGETAVHIILQFFFVADVIDAIILFVRSASLSTPMQASQFNDETFSA